MAYIILYVYRSLEQYKARNWIPASIQKTFFFRLTASQQLITGRVIIFQYHPLLVVLCSGIDLA
jgi:hypothetical protein